MPLAKRDEAEPVQELLDAQTLELVGWVYQWNTGEFAVMWMERRKANIVPGCIINVPKTTSSDAHSNFIRALVGSPRDLSGKKSCRDTVGANG